MKRWAYSDIPSFLSHAAICCMAVTAIPSGLTEFSTTGTESLHRSMRDITRRNMRYRAPAGTDSSLPASTSRRHRPPSPAVPIAK